MLVRGDLHTNRALQIADGYYRVCASYHLDEGAQIPCRLVDPPPTSTQPGNPTMRPRNKPIQNRHSPDHDRIQAFLYARHRAPLAGLLEREPVWARDFTDLGYEWRRLFSKLLGTFMLVLVGAGAPVIDAATHGGIGRIAEVTSPGLMVLAIILFMGAVSGAHLNPVVSIAFALRGDFGWRRVPGYLAAQVAGGVLASIVLRVTFGDLAHLGATMPGPEFTATQAFVVEAILTLGLVSTILGTASSAQNIGPLSAFGVSAYIALAGLWSSPVSGASMNPARSLAPALISADLHQLWIYLTAPLLGALAAVAASYILRGPGGDPVAARAAQGAPPETRDRTADSDGQHR